MSSDHETWLTDEDLDVLHEAAERLRELQDTLFEPWGYSQRVADRLEAIAGEVEDCFCLDCGADPIALDEFAYMLRDDVWRAANPDVEGMLCVGCVETRLGRRLTRDDFALNLPLTVRSSYPRSPRLRARLMETR